MRLSFRRWWLWSAAALLLVSAAIFYISFGLSHRDRVTMGHVRHLKLGMKESEVRRILGEEPALIPCANESRWQKVDPSWCAEEWSGKYMGIRILFDSNGRLCDWTVFIIPDGKFEWTDRVVNSSTGWASDPVSAARINLRGTGFQRKVPGIGSPALDAGPSKGGTS